jgi:hypothetical protein
VSRQILLSYAREDVAVVAEMTADLRALDHEVWLDQDLGGGQDWWDEILARIRWCDAFVPVLSAASLGSRACTGERTYALALQRPVLPIAVGDLGPEGLLDEDLARRQRIAYRPADKPSTLRLLSAVHRLAAAPPLPSVEPARPPAPMAYFGALRAELDGTAIIDYDRQLVLLGRLTQEIEDTDRHPEVAALVQIFLRRREIAAHVERQLTVLRERLQGATSARTPAAAAPVPTGRRESPQRATASPGGRATPSTPSRPTPGRPSAVVVDDGSDALVLKITNPGATFKQVLRVYRESGPWRAVALDGSYLPFREGTDPQGWLGDHGVSVDRLRSAHLDKHARIQVRVGDEVVFEEERSRQWAW